MTFQMADCRLKIASVVLLSLLAVSCAAGKAVSQGDAAMRAGNLDEAVDAYKKAVQASPGNASYKIWLQRAMQAASRSHLEKAHEFERADELEAALGEYKMASEYDPSNR